VDIYFETPRYAAAPRAHAANFHNMQISVRAGHSVWIFRRVSPGGAFTRLDELASTLKAQSGAELTPKHRSCAECGSNIFFFKHRLQCVKLFLYSSLSIFVFKYLKGRERMHARMQKEKLYIREGALE